MLKTSFLYTMPSNTQVWIYLEAEDVSDNFLVNPKFHTFDKSGNPLSIIYNKEVFDDIEDLAHTIISQGEHDEEITTDCEVGEDVRGSKFDSSES